MPGDAKSPYCHAPLATFPVSGDGISGAPAPPASLLDGIPPSVIPGRPPASAALPASVPAPVSESVPVTGPGPLPWEVGVAPDGEGVADVPGGVVLGAAVPPSPMVPEHAVQNA